MSEKAAAKADVLQGTFDLMVLKTIEALGWQHAGRKHAGDQMAGIHALPHGRA